MAKDTDAVKFSSRKERLFPGQAEIRTSGELSPAAYAAFHSKSDFNALQVVRSGVRILSSVFASQLGEMGEISRRRAKACLVHASESVAVHLTIDTHPE